jgi:lysophospholipid acyltransferase (LPLAT)-like uncharacterized protein
VSDESSTPAAPPSAPTVRPAGRPTYSLQGWQRVVIWPLGWFLRTWARTLRFEVAAADQALFDQADGPETLLLWHNRLFLAGEITRRCRRGRTFSGLISASKDGAWLAGFFRMLGISAIRGSSSRGGREAVTALIDELRAGHDIGITPDGPRGPCYDFKPGAFIVARRGGVPLVLVGAEFSAAWRLHSWDRFYLPRPFSRVRIHCRRTQPADLPRDRDEAIAQLRAQLLALNPDL